jgi:hypothetical protein
VACFTLHGLLLLHSYISSNHIQTSPHSPDHKSENNHLISRQCPAKASTGPNMRRAAQQRGTLNQFGLGEDRSSQAVIFNEDFQ